MRFSFALLQLEPAASPDLVVHAANGRRAAPVTLSAVTTPGRTLLRVDWHELGRPKVPLSQIPREGLGPKTGKTSCATFFQFFFFVLIL
jgi:hypothetical protein